MLYILTGTLGTLGIPADSVGMLCISTGTVGIVHFPTGTVAVLSISTSTVGMLQVHTFILGMHHILTFTSLLGHATHAGTRCCCLPYPSNPLPTLRPPRAGKQVCRRRVDVCPTFPFPYLLRPHPRQTNLFAGVGGCGMSPLLSAREDKQNPLRFYTLGILLYSHSLLR